MQSLAEQILARIKIVLAAVPGIQTVERAREDAFGADELPAINIRRIGTQVEPLALGISELKLDFDLDINVHDGETQADALHVAANGLMAADPTLSDLSKNTLFNTGTDSAGDGADRDLYRLAAHYEIRAWFAGADISQPA